MTRARDVADTQDNVGGAVAPFVAGKNKLINGDFYWNQRGFTSTTTSATYMFDRWRTTINGGTATFTAQTLTPAEISGYEGKNYISIATTGQSAVSDYTLLAQKIEDVRTLAGQTVTVSFWAKAATGTPKVGIAIEQIFGTGGSSAVSAKGGDVTISTSWARYSTTFTVPSVSGKTITTSNDSVLIVELWTSAGSNYSSGYTSIGIQNATISLVGIQVEAGSVATPFTTASGSIGGELALCQRYYVAWNTASEVSDARIAMGLASSTTSAGFAIPLPVQMRVAPTTIDWTNTAVNYITAEQTITALSFTAVVNNKQTAALTATVAAGLTANAPYFLSTRLSNRFGLGAEL